MSNYTYPSMFLILLKHIKSVKDTCCSLFYAQILTASIQIVQVIQWTLQFQIVEPIKTTSIDYQSSLILSLFGCKLRGILFNLIMREI